jgi:integrase
MMTLTHAITLFLDQYKASTREGFNYPLQSMAAFIGPARPLDSIRPEHLIEYANTLDRRDYAAATVRKHVKCLRTFFNWLVKIEAIDKSPARAVRLASVPAGIDRDKAMTDAELNAILDYTRHKSSPRDHALILFLADTGCRAGGAANLKLEDLDLDNLRAIVLEKGEKTRPVAYGEDCARAIRIWLLKRPTAAGRFVFSRTQKAISADSVSLVVRRACIRVGIRSLGSHSLRHRKGHQLADNHVAVSVAAKALGHSDPVITMRHYYPHDWDRAEVELKKLAVQRSRKPKNIISLVKDAE